MLPRLHASLPSSTAAAGRVCALRATSSGGSELAQAQREELLQKLHAGERLPSLTFDAVTFIQTPKPNRNYSRLSPAALQKLARTMVGKPFLRDHGQDELAARGGTIVSTTLEKVDETTYELHQQVEAVKPWAQEGLLDGTISMFSIGWSRNIPTDPVCTVCNNSIFSFECMHFPGDEVELNSGRKIICELLYTDVDGVEVSAVNSPAVRGTGIEQIRLALSEHRAGTHERKSAMLTVLTALVPILGCKEDETSVIEAVRALKAKHDAAVAAHVEATTELAAAHKRLETLETEGRAKELEQLIESAYQEGKFLPARDAAGARVQSELEKAFRAMAAGSFDGARAWLKMLPAVGPQGRKLASTDPAPVDPKTQPTQLSEQEKKIARQTGVTDEQYLKFKAERYLAGESAAEAKDKE